MAPFLGHAFILLLASGWVARRLFPDSIDRLLATFLLAWGNVVATCLLLSLVAHLGDPTWFFRTSLLVAGLVGAAVGLIKPTSLDRPTTASADHLAMPLGGLVLFFATLLPVLYINIRIGIEYLPNNYDSLTYHLPRAEYYLGQGTLGHFATGNPRQIFFPFNYNLIQLFGLIYGPPLQVLNFFNIVTWLVSGLAVYRLCRLARMTIGPSLASSWFALTSTQILAQATATTNDLPTGSVLITAGVFVLGWLQTGSRRHTLFAGLALGLMAGSKLTAVYFIPAAGLLVLGFIAFTWPRGKLSSTRNLLKAWWPAAFLAGLFAAPFAIINLIASGHWMTNAYDYIVNKPFSLPCALQTAQGYLVQLFIEPLHRFSLNLEQTSRLNNWAQQTLFPHWKPDYAFSPLYIFPPDLNEDHVWFGFTGGLIFLAALSCIFLFRKRPIISVIAVLGLGWFCAFFALNKWSLYNQRYMVPAILLMSPCLAAVVEASGARQVIRRAVLLVFGAVALSAYWMAGSFLLDNTTRPFAPLWFHSFTPPGLPPIPPLLAARLAPERRVNIDSDLGNERIFLLMTHGHRQRFTASDRIDRDAYNVFARWAFARHMAYTNIEQWASYVEVPFPGKPTAGVEFLGSMEGGPTAIDYYGLPAHAEDQPSATSNRFVFVTLSYGRREPDRYANTRVRVAGLHPRDGAHLILGYEDESGEIVTLGRFEQDCDSVVSLQKPFRRFTLKLVDNATAREIGTADIPHILRTADVASTATPDPKRAFDFNLIVSSPTLTAEGLAPLEGPYEQWQLPAFRWAKSPSVRIPLPSTERIARLTIRYSVRLQARDRGDLDVLLNGKLIKHVALEQRDSWHDDVIEIAPAPGPNVLEFRDVALTDEPDWMAYLDANPDVKDWLVSQSIPLEEGAKVHFDNHGRGEHRTVPPKRIAPPPAAQSLYYVFRELRLEADYRQ